VFTAFSLDHLPRHVHGSYAEVVVIVDLLHDGIVRLSSRVDAVRPSNGRKADIRHVLAVAAKHYNELVALWEKHHG
jgi:uncharacterized protein DUF4160